MMKVELSEMVVPFHLAPGKQLAVFQNNHFLFTKLQIKVIERLKTQNPQLYNYYYYIGQTLKPGIPLIIQM